MLSCSWTAGVPTLSLIPHTDFPSFAAAAQAFHSTHYASNATQLASSFAQNFGSKIGRGAATTAAASGDDMGEKISRVSVKLAAGNAEDIGEKVSRAKVMPAASVVEDVGDKDSRVEVMPAAGSVGDVGQKVDRIAVVPTANTGGDTGKLISRVGVAKGNDSTVSEGVSRAAAQAGSHSKASTLGARAASDSNLRQAVSRPSSVDPEKLTTAVSDRSAEFLPEALGSTSAQSVAAASSLVPKAQSSMNKLSEAKQHPGISHDCIPLEAHKMPVGLAAKPTRRQGAQASKAGQSASPGDVALLVFEDR